MTTCHDLDAPLSAAPEARADGPRRGAEEAPRLTIRARDLAGATWGHPDPLHLYRWLARRNDLLRTIAAAPTPGSGRGRA